MSTVPTVYFIDDSATMREVIKIAFRRENINVVAHHDAAAALGEIEQARPDVVITDVIMPGKDGYDVCQHIKSHPALQKTPVILMSGVVNRAVAERAFAVKADELLRKPFQPQDLITRVKHLLKPNGNGTPAPAPAPSANAAAALSSIFSNATQPRPVATAPLPQPAPGPRAVPAIASVAPAIMPAPAPAPIAVTPAPAPIAVAPAAVPAPAVPSKFVTNGDHGKMKIEILRLEGLVKKLQSELLAEREYSRALEEHVKTLQEAE